MVKLDRCVTNSNFNLVFKTLCRMLKYLSNSSHKGDKSVSGSQSLFENVFRFLR